LGHSFSPGGRSLVSGGEVLGYTTWRAVAPWCGFIESGFRAFIAIEVRGGRIEEERRNISWLVGVPPINGAHGAQWSLR
jgi:hypothetical protein